MDPPPTKMLYNTGMCQSKNITHIVHINNNTGWYDNGGLFVIYTAHQFSVVVLAPNHAVVDDDREEDDGHPHGIAKQLKLTLS